MVGMQANGPKGMARMFRTLAACEAPPAVVATLRERCSWWRKGDLDTAEDLLLSACLEHNFSKPWDQPGQPVVFRPYKVGSQSPGHASDHSRTPIEEQSYRRGFDQGGGEVLRLIEAGKSLDEVRAYVASVRRWRVQPVQEKGTAPGTLHAQALPDRWQDI